MAETDSRDGKWIFRNQRWHYVPVQGQQFDPTPRTIDTEALTSLVDVAELRGPLAVGTETFQLPIQLFLTENPGNRRSAAEEVRYAEAPELLLPAWWSELAGVAPALDELLAREWAALAERIRAEKEPLTVDSPLGKESLAAVPVAFRFQERWLLYGAVVTLVLDREQLPSPRECAQQWQVPEEEAAAARKVLTEHLPEPRLVPPYRTWLEVTVAGYAGRLQQVYESRLELAAEQVRSRHLLVRAENLERRLLQGTAEVDKARDRSGVMTRELAALLDNPHIGVTIEDTNHRVRYQNPMLRRRFGNMVGRLCYEAFKGRSKPCQPCAIDMIWEEGRESVRYTTTDPRSGRSFEVFSLPLVSESGEKLIVEVGVDVTELLKETESLEERVARQEARNRQLTEMVEMLNVVLLETAGDLGDLLLGRSLSRSSQAEQALDSMLAEESTEERLDRVSESFDELTHVAQRAGQIALALAETAPPVPVSVSSRLAALVEALYSGESAPSVRCAVMPAIVADPRALDRLLEVLVGEVLAEMGEVQHGLAVSHTMSAVPEAIAPGDAFHILSVGADAPPSEGDPQLEITHEISGVSEGLAGTDSTRLVLASLLVRRMGGAIWRRVRGERNVTFFFSLPASPG